MRPFDVLPIAFLLSAGAGLFLGALALARSDDLHALYWLTVGASTLRAAVQLARAGGQAG